MEPCAIEMNITIIRGTEATVHNSEPGVRAAVCELTNTTQPSEPGQWKSQRVRTKDDMGNFLQDIQASNDA